MGKVFIDVLVEFNKEGQRRPISFRWEDGRVFTIDRILDSCRAASLKAGGHGIRYKCRVHGKEIFLYNDDGKWFIETKR